MLYYFGGDGNRLEYKLKSTKQKIIRRNSCGNLLMCKLKMDNIKDKFKSLEEKAKTLEEILQKMNEVADGNVDKFLYTGFLKQIFTLNYVNYMLIKEVD